MVRRLRRCDLRMLAVENSRPAFLDSRPAGSCRRGEQLLDLFDGLAVVPVTDRVNARFAGTGNAQVHVIEEDRLAGADVQAGTDQGIDPRIGLAHPSLVGIDDLVDEVLESVCRLLPLPGADETIAQDPGTVPGAQPTGVFDQFRVRGAQVLAPDVAHIRRELVLVQAEAIPDRLVHTVQGDHAKAAVHPDIAHAPAHFPGRQSEPGLPPPVDAEVRGDLQHAADVKHHRADHHDDQRLPTPGTVPGAPCWGLP